LQRTYLELGEKHRFNFDAHQLPNAHAVQGDLRAAICRTGFDFIFFNAPYYGERPKDWLEPTVTDENYDTLKRFIADVETMSCGRQRRHAQLL
jgi:methylase of polypeptide subunit release factors